MDLLWLFPATDPKSGVRCLWGLGGCTLGGKGHTTQLCKLMEMFSMLQLCLPLCAIPTAAQTVLSYKAGLWIPQEPKKQLQYDLPKAVRVEHWIQASELHANAWSPQLVAADQAEVDSMSGVSTKHPSPSMSSSHSLWLGGAWDLTEAHNLLGFVGFLPVHLACNAAWHLTLERLLTSVLVRTGNMLIGPTRGILKVNAKSRLLW